MSDSMILLASLVVAGWMDRMAVAGRRPRQGHPTLHRDNEDLRSCGGPLEKEKD
jgi:hypothetical protein